MKNCKIFICLQMENKLFIYTTCAIIFVIGSEQEEIIMNKMKKFMSAALVAALSATMVMGCGSKPAEKEVENDVVEETEETTILVAAAASLQYSYDEEIIPMFEAANPGIKVEATYDSSGKLQTQIEEGMEADVFMAAAMKQMNALVEEEYIADEDVVKLLENEVVLITAADADLGMTEFTDILKANTIAIGDPESVPVGQYAQDSFTNLGIWDDVLAKASLGTNVTEVLNWVAEGSAEAGVVYATDAATTDKVKVIAKAPAESLTKKAIYPVAALKDSANKEAADKFVEFLTSEDAVKVFEKYGFIENK